MNKAPSKIMAGMALLGAACLTAAGCSAGTTNHHNTGKTGGSAHSPYSSADPKYKTPANGHDPAKDISNVKLMHEHDSDGTDWALLSYDATNRTAVPHSYTATFAIYWNHDTTNRAMVFRCTAENVQPGETVTVSGSNDPGCATDSEAYDSPGRVAQLDTYKLISVDLDQDY